MSRIIPARRACGGQALTEFLVIAVVLLPLFLLMPMIAKYQDISHASLMASRYLAFEASSRNDTLSTWKSEPQLAAEVRRRFFSNTDAPIKTNDVAGNFMANQNLFWRDPKDAPLITNFDNAITVSFGPAEKPGQADAFSAADDGVPFTGGSLAPGAFNVNEKLGLPAKGIYTGNVSVKLANLPAGLKFYEPFDNINLTMRRHTSLLIDGWQAKSPAVVAARLNTPNLIPLTVVSGLAPYIDEWIADFEARKIAAPKLGELDFWRDVVPADRLK